MNKRLTGTRSGKKGTGAKLGDIWASGWYVGEGFTNAPDLEAESNN